MHTHRASRARQVFGAFTAATCLFQTILAVDLDVNSADSIRQASSTLAGSLLSYYDNDKSSTPADQVGVIQVPPLYWWESGAVWGAMVDYWAYTGDDQYVGTTQTALLAQIGPDRNYMPPAFYYSLGNDDQAFWALSTLAAAEYGFPTPSGQSSSVWLDLTKAVYESQVQRWDPSSCGGGLRWQIFSYNKGYNYKNTVSNGALFQIAARLARLTGDDSYIPEAEKLWNWMDDVGFISEEYYVYDGAQIDNNCQDIDRVAWTYNHGLLMYGAAILYNHTGQQVWQDRLNSLVQSSASLFFSPYANSTDIMYEMACEPYNTCNYDQFSFKAFLSRWMSKSAVVVPSILNTIQPLLSRSAQAAAQSCTGGSSGTECGTKWYVGGYDGGKPGIPSVGQGLSAFETIQSLLLLRGDAKIRFPIGKSVQQQSSAPAPSSTTTSSSQAPTVSTTSKSTTSPSPSPSSVSSSVPASTSTSPSTMSTSSEVVPTVVSTTSPSSTLQSTSTNSTSSIPSSTTTSSSSTASTSSAPATEAKPTHAHGGTGFSSLSRGASVMAGVVLLTLQIL